MIFGFDDTNIVKRFLKQLFYGYLPFIAFFMGFVLLVLNDYRYLFQWKIFFLAVGLLSFPALAGFYGGVYSCRTMDKYKASLGREKDFLVSEIPNILQIATFGAVVGYYLHAPGVLTLSIWLFITFYLNNRRHIVFSNPENKNLLMSNIWLAHSILGVATAFIIRALLH